MSTSTPVAAPSIKRSEIFALLALLPTILIAQLAQVGMGSVDTIMAGKLDSSALAGVAAGTSLYYPVVLFAQGVLMAVTPIVAHLLGARQHERIAFQLRHAIVLAAALSVPVILFMWFSAPFFKMAGSQADIASIGVGYLQALCWGVPASMGWMVLRCLNDALSQTRAAMIISLLGLLVNIPANYVLVYGKFGFPQLGGVGCGYATSLVSWFMFGCMLFYCLKNSTIRELKLFAAQGPLQRSCLVQQLKIGLPIGGAMFFEVSLFAVVALLLTPLGKVAVAGHQVALNVSALLFMLPLSLGIAATIRVGYLQGAAEYLRAKCCANMALLLGLAFTAMTAVLTLLLRGQIAALYTNAEDVAVQALAQSLLLFAAVYQLSDAVQTVGIGILRGYKDTKAIFVISFISYWLVGFPIGYVLALGELFGAPLGPKGFWIGFIVGLSCAAVLLKWRIAHLQKRYMQRA